MFSAVVVQAYAFMTNRFHIFNHVPSAEEIGESRLGRSTSWHELLCQSSCINKYGAGEVGIERVSDTTPRYIRITDIDENGELLPGLGMTAANVEPQYFLRDRDLLLARSGNTVGKSYL